jgi:hypothetical protein
VLDNNYISAFPHTECLGSDREAFEMVQTYGITRDDGGEPRNDVEDGEATSLLRGNARETVRKDGHATITSCVSNLSNTIIGSGRCIFILFAKWDINSWDLVGMLTFPLVGPDLSTL